MAAPSVGQMVGTLDTAAMGLVHDAQLDYYGKRLAAASSDFTVFVWDVTDGQQKPAGQLKAHEGPVWKVSWAHPKFGSLIATCGYDMKVIIWKEVPAYSANWQIAFVDTSHQASVNDVQFCPWEHGLRLACASSDGTVSVLSYAADHQWRRTAFQAHMGGAQALSWMPAAHREASSAGCPMRLATCGCDSSVSVWKNEGEVWSQEMPPLPSPHSDWVRAVAWRPDDGRNNSVIASGAWDKTVVIFTQEMEGQPWRQTARLTLPDKVEGLSWSVTGSILAVSYGDGEATLYKEAFNGSYVEVGKVAETGFTEVPHNLGGPPAAAPPPAAVPQSPQGLDLAATGLFAEPPAPAAAPAPAAPDPFAAQQQNVLEAFGM